MEIADVVAECKRLGVTMVGFTDHLNSLEFLEQHRFIREDIEKLDDTDTAVYFGVEVNYLGLDGEFPFSAEIKEEYGFQFAIGGIHENYLEEYDLEKLVDVQHRHHLKTCRDPLVDVLVHPYWFNKKRFDKKNWPWFDSMKSVPESYARELGQTARDTGTAVEINASAILCNPNLPPEFVEEYMTFLGIISEQGACFALGSDAHDIGKLEVIEKSWSAAEQLHLPPERFWIPPVPPIKDAV
jgi:histidinol phosphatase-like PHP family hydrolase